jgi:carboxyl-terminal processing protease
MNPPTADRKIAAGRQIGGPAASQSSKDLMNFYPFYSKLRKRTFRWLLSLLLAMLWFTAGMGCEPTTDNKTSASSSDPNAATAAAEVSPPTVSIQVGAGAADAVVERILTGDFAGAEQTCESLNPQTDPRTAQLAGVLSRYDDLQKKREQKRRQAIEDQQKELNTQRQKIRTDAIEPNDIDATLAAAIRLREHMPEAKKDSVLQNEFVQNVIRRAKQNAQQNEKQGKWIDAYVHCYYWLTLLYEDNKEYKDCVDRLTEMASIELSLKKNDCGETAIERYKGIEPFMFMRALQALEANYVHDIDYAEMCDKAIERCRLLGRVLADSPEELAWRVDPNQVTVWTAQLDAIKSNLKQNKNEKTMRDIAQLFDQTVALNKTTLGLPQEVIVAHFTESALSSLDPFTNIVWPWDVREFEKSMTQQFTGIGVEISKETGILKVASLLPNTPACRAGLDAEDEIVAVNGEPTEKLSIYCAVSKITGGPRGTKVKLTIRRPSIGKTWDVTIVRDTIIVQPLRGWRRKLDGQWDWMIDPANRIGYIRLTTFTETSGPDLDAILTRLEKDGLNGLVLDLRYNPGGYLNSAAEVADLFVSQGVIVKSTPRHGFATYEIAHAKGTHPGYPLVILINGNSASASEIVAGALQDPKHNRATLVGQRSYGKGSVQVVIPYTGGDSQLKYTVAYYHLPSDQQVKNHYQMEKLGRKDWGIAPDVEVKMTTSELREMLDVQRDNDVLVQANHDETKAPVKRSTLQRTLNSDPQLAVALLVAQSKMIQTGQMLQLPQDPNSIAIGMATQNKK